MRLWGAFVYPHAIGEGSWLDGLYGGLRAEHRYWVNMRVSSVVPAPDYIHTESRPLFRKLPCIDIHLFGLRAVHKSFVHIGRKFGGERVRL